MSLTRRRLLLSGLATLAAPAVLRAAPAVTALEGAAFGTFWQVVLPEGAATIGLHAGIVDLLDGIDRKMSPWRADSVITRFNRSPDTGWQTVDVETAHVAQAALTLRADSGGAFDPSVGPLVARWGFGPIDGGVTGAGLFCTEDALSKSDPGLTLDLCGIAKGHALDRMADLLRDRGLNDFVIDLGGEIAAHGHHPAGRNWQVAVEDPAGTGAAEVLALSGLSVATSGHRINGFTLAGRRYGHVIDPVTQEPVESAIASISVMAERAMLADAWATALMAAGAGGPDLARQRGLDALFLTDGGGRIATGGFDRHLA